MDSFNFRDLKHTQNEQELLWPTSVMLLDLRGLIEKNIHAWLNKWNSTTQTEYKISVKVASESSIRSDSFTNWEVFKNQEHSFWLAFHDMDDATLSKSALINHPIFSKNILSHSEIVGGLNGQVLSDLKGHLQLLFGLEGAVALKQRPSEEMFNPWSGGVVVELLLTSTKVILLLPHKIYENLGIVNSKNKSLKKPELANVLASVSQEKVTLNACLLPCELDLGTLQNLSVGDVIRLSHSLIEPVLIESQDNLHISSAFLGRFSDKKAIEFSIKK